MTYKQIKFLVGQLVKVDGNQYVDPADAVNFGAFMNDRLVQFSIDTLCLYRDDVAFSPDNDASPDGPVFDFRTSAAFARPMAYIDHIYWNGSFLMNPLGQPGPWTIDELAGAYPTYPGDPQGVVAADTLLWTQLAPTSIRLYKKPVHGASAGLATGWVTHKALSADGDLPEFPVEHHRTFCYYAAASLMEPFAGEMSIEKIARLDSMVAKRMEELTMSAELILGRLQKRGRSLSYVQAQAPAQGQGQS